tara:strand:- start:2596 stop:3213 length:618 start_codon:yes stop_codon:yes gene_type:complete
MYIGCRLEEKAISMSNWNQMNVADRATELLIKVKEPRRRQILENFIEHATAECVGDYKRLMASCSKKRQRYEVYGRDIDRSTLPQSYKALEKHYHKLIEQNLYNIHTELESLSVGEDSLVLDTITHQLLSGANVLRILGIDMKDSLGVYMVSRRLCIIFIFDEDGLGCGEHAYCCGPATKKHLTKLSPEQVPESFNKQFSTRKDV